MRAQDLASGAMPCGVRQIFASIGGRERLRLGVQAGYLRQGWSGGGRQGCLGWAAPPFSTGRTATGAGVGCGNVCGWKSTLNRQSLVVR